MEKIITINTKKTASDTALVELSPGNALDTVDPSISIDKWSFVIVFFLALLDPYLIFQIAIIIALFIYLLFFSECILPGSVFWGLWSPRNYNSLNFYIVFITRITLSQSHQFPLTKNNAQWRSYKRTEPVLQIADVVCRVVFLLFLPRFWQ